MSSPPIKNFSCPAHISLHTSSQNPKASHHLIYLITGNPGLIGYYKSFLSTLHTLLSSSETDTFHIHGQTLSGFEVDDVQEDRLYSLEDQIENSLQCLKGLTIESGPRKGQLHDSVILIGHSVGSYILLEMIRRLQKREDVIQVRAGILLFPTVTHIAQSPSGTKMSFVFRIPNFPKAVSMIAKVLVALAPKSVLKWLIGIVTRMPNDAIEVTTSFLASKMGVWQALHLAKDEMETITEDRWDEDIWGIEHKNFDSKAIVPKLIFYFGEKDHWVADHTRDALIAARGKSDQDDASFKPIMLLDENGIDHSFCLRASESIAEKVKVWVDTIVSI